MTSKFFDGVGFRPTTSCGVVAACGVISSMLIFVVAPTETTMGDVQRILYLHVAVAWCGLACAMLMGFSAAMYLTRRRLEWDAWSLAAGEVGWLCATLTLVSGSAWAHEAWGTWWTWDPRLTSTLILWLIYAGIVVLRGSIEDPHRRARLSSVLTLVGVADVPLVIMATRWFRGIHPVAPDMDTRMRLVLLASVICFTVLVAYLIIQRRFHLALTDRETQVRVESWCQRNRRSH